MKHSYVRKVLPIVFVLTLVVGIGGIADLAIGDFQLGRSSVSGSGGQSSGGAFAAWTTTSQPDAGEGRGGEYELSGSIAEGDPADCAALVAAFGLVASDAFCDGVRVTWIDNCSHETGYRVRRDSVEIAVTQADVTAYADSAAVPGVVYSYTVVTTNDCGDANPSDGDTGHRPLKPVAPDNLEVVMVWFISDSLVLDLSWNDNSADETSQIIYQVDSTLTAIMTLPPNIEAAQVRVPFEGDILYCFAVAAANCDLEAESDTACIDATGAPEDSPPLPAAFALGKIAPNPFNSRLMIALEVPRAAPVALRIYDLSGRWIRNLQEGSMDPGRHVIGWDGRDDKGRLVASGIYFVEIRAPGFRQAGRLIFLK